METSRKIAIGAFIVLVASQFFAYAPSADAGAGFNSITGFIDGQAHYEGATGWQVHDTVWFYIPIMVLFAYLFFSSKRSITMYWLFLPFFFVTGFGPGMGGAMGIGSILIYGYAIYKKSKENTNKKSS